MRRKLGISWLFWALASAWALSSCTSDAQPEKVRIHWALGDSLSAHYRIVITLRAAADSNQVLDTVFSGRLDNPVRLPPYDVKEQYGRDFYICIQAYTERGRLVFESFTRVQNGNPGAPVRTPVPASGTDARLSSLGLSAGAASPAFHPDSLSYAVALPENRDTLIVIPVPRDPNATLTVGGDPLPVHGKSLGLQKGETRDLVVQVVSEDGKSHSLYTLKITRAPSSEARLASLTVSPAALSPGFHIDTLAYNVALAAEQDSLVVSAAARDARAHVTLDGIPMAAATAQTLRFKEGETRSILIEVQAQDSAVRKVYILNVARASTIKAWLSDLVLSDGRLSPDFQPDTLAYAVTIALALDSLVVTPIPMEANARLAVDGAPLPAGATGFAVRLAKSESRRYTIQVLVGDSATRPLYSLRVTKASASAALLSALTANGGNLLPQFYAETETYSTTVAKTSLTVTAIPQTAGAAILVNGKPVNAFGVSPSLPLAVGNNSITVAITAGNGVDKKSYSIAVNRPTKSSMLDSLLFTGFAMDSAFRSDKFYYKIKTAASTAEIKFHFMMRVGGPTISATCNGKETPFIRKLSGDNLQAEDRRTDLQKGLNRIAIAITAPDKSSKATYIIDVTRP